MTYLGPFAVTHVAVGDATIEVGTLGEGLSVVLLAGRGGSATEQFAKLGPALAEAGYCAVAVNLRGTGASSGLRDGLTLHDLADDVAHVIDHFGAPAPIVARAFGGRVARCLAADRPDLVSKLVLLGAGGRVEPGPEARTLGLLQHSGVPVPYTLWREAGRAHREANQRTPTDDWWAGGDVPILVLQGVEDLIAPPANGRLLLREYPDRVQVVEVERAGHLLLLDRPDVVIPAIVGYVAETTDREQASDAS